MNRRILTKVNYLLTCINVRVGGCILNINNNINKDYEVTSSNTRFISNICIKWGDYYY